MSDKWFMIKVSPLRDGGIFVQRGGLHRTKEAAERECAEWAEVYKHARVEECRDIDIKMYGDNMIKRVRDLPDYVEHEHLPTLPWISDETGFCHIIDRGGQNVADTGPSSRGKRLRNYHGSTYQWNATQYAVMAANRYVQLVKIAEAAEALVEYMGHTNIEELENHKQSVRKALDDLIDNDVYRVPK